MEVRLDTDVDIEWTQGLNPECSINVGEGSAEALNALAACGGRVGRGGDGARRMRRPEARLEPLTRRTGSGHQAAERQAALDDLHVYAAVGAVACAKAGRGESAPLGSPPPARWLDAMRDADDAGTWLHAACDDDAAEAD
eukprot:gene2357-biopygen9077